MDGPVSGFGVAGQRLLPLECFQSSAQRPEGGTPASERGWLVRNQKGVGIERTPVHQSGYANRSSCT